jgi:hypothetical protein
MSSSATTTTTGFVLYDLEKSETDLSLGEGPPLEDVQIHKKDKQESDNKEKESTKSMLPFSTAVMDGLYALLSYGDGTHTSTTDDTSITGTGTSSLQDEIPNNDALLTVRSENDKKVTSRTHTNPVIVLKSVPKNRKNPKPTMDTSKRRPVLGFLRALGKRPNNHSHNANNHPVGTSNLSSTTSRFSETNKSSKHHERRITVETIKRDNFEKIAPIVEKSLVAPFIPSESNNDSAVRKGSGATDCLNWILSCCTGGQGPVDGETNKGGTKHQDIIGSAELDQKGTPKVSAATEEDNTDQSTSTPIIEDSTFVREDGYHVKPERANHNDNSPVAADRNIVPRALDGRPFRSDKHDKVNIESKSDYRTRREVVIHSQMSTDSSKMTNKDFRQDNGAGMSISIDSGEGFSFESTNSSVVFQEHTCFQPVIPSTHREAILYGVKGRPRLARKKSIIRKTPTFDDTFSNEEYQYSVFVVNNQVADDSSNQDQVSRHMVRDPCATRMEKNNDKYLSDKSVKNSFSMKSKRLVNRHAAHASTSETLRTITRGKRQEEDALDDDSEQESIAAASYDRFPERNPLEYGSLESVSSADLSEPSSAAFAKNEMNLSVEPMCMIYDL